MDKSNKDDDKIQAGCGCAFIVILILALAGYCTGNSENSSSEGEDHFLAYSQAEEFVKERLKSPRTAKFPGTLERLNHTKYIGNNTYVIYSWVDSQNSFGAIIRTQFSCKIRIAGDVVKAEEIIFHE